jgi:hypothetical protein
VLDPAVGSGSFLIGMLNEILWLKRRTAAARGLAVTPETVAGWKEAIIRDSLCGVDIKPEAIEIAQLRLWLALVVDQTLDQARPLPNLDYKLMTGDSLIETLDGEPVLLGAAKALVDGEFEPQQASLALFGADQHRLKLADATARQRRLLDLVDALNKPNAPRPFFLYRLHFSEVFARGGLDIVVANPLCARRAVGRAQGRVEGDGHLPACVRRDRRSVRLFLRPRRGPAARKRPVVLHHVEQAPARQLRQGPAWVPEQPIAYECRH